MIYLTVDDIPNQQTCSDMARTFAIFLRMGEFSPKELVDVVCHHLLKCIDLRKPVVLTENTLRTCHFLFKWNLNRKMMMCESRQNSRGQAAVSFLLERPDA